MSNMESLFIGNEIQRAAKDLPEGWSIQIELERDAGTVTLHNPAGETVEVETSGEPFSSQIGMTIDVAIEAYREKQGGALAQSGRGGDAGNQETDM